MTGVYTLIKNGKEIKQVERPNEIWDDIDLWWSDARLDDVIQIRCDCPD